jgi:DNA-binding beta-propeller fold protein YncE
MDRARVRVFALFGLAIVMLSGVFSLSGAVPALANPVSGTIATGVGPSQVILAGTKAYVLNTADITVIDTVTNTRVATITPDALSGSGFDRGVYVPGDGSFWVSRWQLGGGQVIRINTATDQITHTFSDGVDSQVIKEPSGVAASGTKVYVAMNGNDTIAVFDIAGKTRDPNLGYNASAGSADSPFRLAVVGTTLYIFQGSTNSVVPWDLAAGSGNQGAAISTGLVGGTSNVTVLPGTSVIYFGNGTRTRSLTAPGNTLTTVLDGSTDARQITFDPTGSRMFIARSGGVTVIQLSDNSVVGNLAVTNGSGGIGVAPSGNHLYLSVNSSNLVSVISLNPTLTTSAAQLTINTVSTIPAPVASGFWSDPAYTSTALPAGLTLNSSTGAIEGTPTQAGVTSVTITATNPTMFTRTSTFTITVIDPDAPPPAPESGSGDTAARDASRERVSTETSVPTLARTGVTMTPSLLVGSFLVMTGVAAWMLARHSLRGIGKPTP